MQFFSWLTAFCAICIWAFGGQLCVAQQVDSLLSSRSLSEIEIVGDAVGAASFSSAPIQEVHAVDIERSGSVTVADAVKRMAGVQVQDYGGIGGLKTVSVRGLGAKHTTLSYDGVAVSDAYSGQVDIGRYTLDNVETLSLMVGQGNDIFRPAREFASVGLIEIKSRRPLATQTMAKLRCGSFGYKGAVLSREDVLGEHWSYSANVNMQVADGDYLFTLVNGALSCEQHRANSDIKSIAAEGNIFGDFGSSGNLQFKIACFDSERGLPGSVKLYSKDSNERLWDNNFLIQAKGETFFDERWQARAIVKYNYSFSRYLQINENYATGYLEDANTQNEFYASLGMLYKAGEHLSLSITTDAALFSLKNNFLIGKEPQRVNSQTVMAVAYESGSFLAATSLLATFISDDAGGSSAIINRKRLSPAVSVAWQPFADFPLRLRASYKDVFRLPTMADLYYQRMGNVGLKPERATQYNAGVTYSVSPSSEKSFAISIDGYYNSVKDKIVALPTMYVWRMQNYGRVYIKGVDATISASAVIARDVKIDVDATYSYSHTVDKTNGGSKNYGHQIPYTPRHAANGSFTLTNRWFNFSYLVTFVGERYMLPQNIVENKIPSYAEHSLSVGKKFSLWNNALLRLKGEALNIADKSYEIIRYYPMPGRQWRFTVCLTF